MTESQQAALDAITGGKLAWVEAAALDAGVLAELVAAEWVEVWSRPGYATLTPTGADKVGRVVAERVELVRAEEEIERVEWVDVVEWVDGERVFRREARRRTETLVRVEADELPYWEKAEEAEAADRERRPIKLPRERGVGHRPAFWWDAVPDRRELPPDVEAELREAAEAVTDEWSDGPVRLFGMPLVRAKSWHRAEAAGATRRPA